jgi:hypothetical protein
LNGREGSKSNPVNVNQVEHSDLPLPHAQRPLLLIQIAISNRPNSIFRLEKAGSIQQKRVPGKESKGRELDGPR